MKMSVDRKNEKATPQKPAAKPTTGQVKPGHVPAGSAKTPR